MLVNELESFSSAIGRAVAEHHERYDGTGYPRRIAGNAISIPGQIVSVAEMIADVLAKERPLERAALALKIFSGEHARPLMAAIAGALRDEKPNTPSSSLRSAAMEDVPHLVARMAAALDMAEQVQGQSLAKSQAATELMNGTINRIRNVQRAIVSTGLDMYLNAELNAADGDDPALVFEKEVATREIQWRLRDIARDLALQSAQPTDRLLFVPLINLLDDDFSIRSATTLPTETTLTIGTVCPAGRTATAQEDRVAA